MTLERAVTDYEAKTPRSRQLFEEALRVMPGGNSRTTTFFDPYPFYITRGDGARVWDADGIERLDFNGNYTSLILGHANPAVVKAIQDAAVHGMSFPGPSEHEIRLAEILTTRIPGMEVVRFANSGTEATMHAVRVARAFTGRAKIAKFEGAYHGCTYGNVGFMPLNAMVVLVFGLASRNPVLDPKVRRALRLLALATLSVLLGNAISVFYGTVLKINPPVSWADPFYLGSNLITLVALLSFPLSQRTPHEWRKFARRNKALITTAGLVSAARKREHLRSAVLLLLLALAAGYALATRAEHVGWGTLGIMAALALPKGTPVLAARKGTVVRVHLDGRIDILHEDATIGTYSHLETLARNLTVGKTVTTDDVLGIAGPAESKTDAYLQLVVWRPEPRPTATLVASTQEMGFDSVSFPLPFSATASDPGKVLTKSQPVVRSTVPALSKLAHRKPKTVHP